MLKSKAKKCKTQGFGMIEIIIAATIISLALASLAFLGNFAIRIQTHLKQNLIATNLAVEAMEAARAVKEESWINFSALGIDTPYHPQKGGAPLKWSLVSGAEIINGLSRQVVLSQVFRDDNDDIADSGMSDSGTRKITATVSWSERGNNYEVKLESYLTNLK